MAQKKKKNFLQAILNLVVVVPAFYSLVKKIIALIGLEIRLAGKSLLTLIVLLFSLAIIITSTWICILVVLFYFLAQHLSLPLTMTCIIASNLFILLLLIIFIKKTSRRLSFPLLRQHLDPKNFE